MSGPLVVRTDPAAPDPAAVAAAAEALRDGQVIAVPTDTVYGLAVDPWAPGASGRLFAVKGRPRGVRLPVLVADVSQAARLVGDHLPPAAAALASRFWPGPLTVVVEATAGHGADLGEESPTVGLRCPDHAVIRAVCVAAGPIAVTSANLHGSPPCTTAGAVLAQMEGVALVVDAGACDGTPSTVVDATVSPPAILRAGAIGSAALAEALATRAPFPRT